MTRWLMHATAVTAGWTGLAAAQPLSPAALANAPTTPASAVRGAAPEDVVVLLMRTTGQPDRKLKVMNRSTFDNGDVLVDVRDEATGQQFTLPGQMADRLPRAGAATPSADPPRPGHFPPPPVPTPPVATMPPASATVPVPEPQIPVPPPPTATPTPAQTGGVQWQAIRTAPPTVPVPSPSVATPAPASAAPVIPPVAAPPAPGLKTIPSPVAVPPSQWKVIPGPGVPPAPAGPNDRWKVIPPPSPTPNPPGDDDGITVRGQMPSSLGGRPTSFQSSTGTAAKPQPLRDAAGTLPPAEKLLPRAVPQLVVPPPSRLPPTPTPPPPLTRPPAAVPQPRVTQPVPPPPPARPPVAVGPKIPDTLPPALPVVESPKPPPRFVPTPTPIASPGFARAVGPRPEAPVFAAEARVESVPTVVVERADGGDYLGQLVRAEMRPMENDLNTALRPSVRMTAASNLADMRYAARPEVKAVLVRSAMTDPAAQVRTECVRALTQLGYSDPEYLTFLQATAGGDAADALRLAAADALRQLRPRE